MSKTMECSQQRTDLCLSSSRTNLFLSLLFLLIPSTDWMILVLTPRDEYCLHRVLMKMWFSLGETIMNTHTYEWHLITDLSFPIQVNLTHKFQCHQNKQCEIVMCLSNVIYKNIIHLLIGHKIIFVNCFYLYTGSIVRLINCVYTLSILKIMTFLLLKLFFFLQHISVCCSL